MKEHIQQLTRLNIELEGLLHVLATRDTDDLRKLLGEKYSQFTTLFEELMAKGQPVEEAAEETLDRLDMALTDDEVKDQEAVSDEIEDETDEASAAIEDGLEKGEENFDVESLDAPGEEVSPEDHDIHDAPEVAPMDDAEIVSVSLEEEEATEEHPAVQPEPTVVSPAPVETRVDEPVSEPLESPASPVVNDDIRVDEMLTRRGAEDLKKVFTLNDKFRFRRELFQQNDDMFRQALSELDSMPNYAAACTYVRNLFATPENTETIEDFLAIIKPHYC